MMLTTSCLQGRAQNCAIRTLLVADSTMLFGALRIVQIIELLCELREPWYTHAGEDLSWVALQWLEA